MTTSCPPGPGLSRALLVSALALLTGLLLAAGVILFVTLGWAAPCDYLAAARGVLAKEARFANVTVSAPYPWPNVLLLEGHTRTEADKWDARDAIWKWTSDGDCRPKGILTHVWSEEFRDAQVEKSMRRDPPPGRLRTGSPECSRWGEC